MSARFRWTRRDFNRSLALGGLGSLLGCGTDPTPVPRAVPRGVLLITADDLGWRDLGAYGLTSVATPNLDRLADEGVAFDHAFDVVSTCSSSRATLATGLYPHTHGVTGLTHRHPELSLDPGAATVARTLEALGHRTALQGKWHLSAEEPPPTFGYRRYLPTDIDQRIRDVDAALAFLHDADEPFFLELNFMQTHRDLFDRFPQAPGFEVSPDDAPPPDWWGLPDWPEVRDEVAGYFSQLRWMDALVGQVLDTLDDQGLADDTLVAFVSDNGPAFPGCKLTLYDRGTGTPLMFRWPAALAPRWESELVSTTQVGPTLVELAGGTPLPGAQGRSLAPLLWGEDWTPQRAIFSEMEQHIGPKPARAVRNHRYKYIRNLTDTPWGAGDGDPPYFHALAQEPGQTWDQPRPPEELYDLDSDPLERTNLVDTTDHADVLASLRAQLRFHAVQTGDFRAGEL